MPIGGPDTSNWDGYALAVSDAAIHRLYSYDDYLGIERASSLRNEYVDGYIRAMAGGTGRHNRLAGRVYRLLADVAEGSGCAAYVEGRRLDLMLDDVRPRSYYPDVMVVCDQDDDALSETAPCFVAEVLSDSTAAIDQIEKLAAYAKVPSILAYTIISQSERTVVLHRRLGAELRPEFYRDDDVISLDCPPVRLTVAELYTGIPLGPV